MQNQQKENTNNLEGERTKGFKIIWINVNTCRDWQKRENQNSTPKRNTEQHLMVVTQ